MIVARTFVNPFQFQMLIAIGSQYGIHDIMGCKTIDFDCDLHLDLVLKSGKVHDCYFDSRKYNKVPRACNTVDFIKYINNTGGKIRREKWTPPAF